MDDRWFRLGDHGRCQGLTNAMLWDAFQYSAPSVETNSDR